MDDIQCFTIREIESAIECLNNNENPYDVLMTIYGGRSRQEIKEKLKDKLKAFNILKESDNKNNKDNILPDKFPECFINDSLIHTVKSVLLALRNK